MDYSHFSNFFESKGGCSLMRNCLRALRAMREVV